MSIYQMTRSQLIEKIKRDEAATNRAAGMIADNEKLQEKNRELHAALKSEKAKPPREVERVVTKRVEVPGPERVVTKRVEVPGPERVVTKRVEVEKKCSKQADQIKALRRELAKARSEAKGLAKEISEQRQYSDRIKSKLDKFAKYDMTEFNKWLQMRAVAKVKT